MDTFGQKGKNFTPRQQQAMLALAGSPSVAEASRQSQVGYTTLRRWLKDDDFRRELDRLRQEAAELAGAQLQGLMLQSVTVLADAMNDPKVSVRLHAARIALAYGVRLGQLEKFQQQLEAVEDALPIWARHYREK